MESYTLIKLVEQIQRDQCESQTLEVKAAAVGTPKRLYDTLSSFSNQDAGGVIVFGLDEKKGFELVGIFDVQQLQHDVSEQCKQMEPEVRPLMTVAEMDSKLIMAVEIPGCDIAERPVFYKGAGRLRGSYIRSGDADEPMSEYEIYSYEAFRRRIRDDLRIVDEASVTMLRGDCIEAYITNIRKKSKHLDEYASNDDILELMGIMKSQRITMAGALNFGKYPQAWFPRLCITAVVVPGMQMGDVGYSGERFLANETITGTLSDMLEDAIRFVERNQRHKTVIDPDGRRRDKPEFPIKAVREVLLNALIHRDYSHYTEGTPITLCMYTDRMEVMNKGGLYGRVSVDSLGKAHPDTRNPAIAGIMEALDKTENRYSGIPTILNEMKNAGLPKPVFRVKDGEFTVILYNGYGAAPAEEHVFNESPRIYDATQHLLHYCEEPRTREEISRYMNRTWISVKNQYITKLLEAGMIRMTIPDHPKAREQRFITVQKAI